MPVKDTVPRPGHECVLEQSADSRLHNTIPFAFVPAHTMVQKQNPLHCSCPMSQ